MKTTETQSRHSVQRMVRATAELQKLLLDWRAAERRHAKAVLRAEHPLGLRSMADSLEYALHKLRTYIDSEPWAALARDESPNDKVSDQSGRVVRPLSE